MLANLFMERKEVSLKGVESLVGSIGRLQNVVSVEADGRTAGRFKVTADRLFLIVDVERTDNGLTRIRVLPYESREDFEADPSARKHPFLRSDTFVGAEAVALGELQAWISKSCADPRARWPYLGSAS